MIEIQTLGRFAVRVDGQQQPRLLTQPTRLSVLLYLAVERETTREVLETVAWGDSAPDSARHSLNQTLYRLRRDLGDDWVVSEGERLRVTDRVRVDTRELEDAVEAGAWARALALYEGDFLQGLTLLDSNPFQQWVDGERARLARRHRQANRARIAELRAAGEAEQALGVAREWLRKDPLEDEAHHVLIELLGETGRRSEALGQYDRYAALLAEQDLRPLDSTEDLVRRIREGSGADRLPGELAPESPATESGSAPAGPGGSTSPGQDRIRTRGTTRGRLVRSWAWIAAACLLVLGTAVGAFLVPDAPADLDPRLIMVLPLENRTGDPSLDPVGQLVADWIAHGLSQVAFLDVVAHDPLVPAGEPGPEGGGTGPIDRGVEAAAARGAGTLATGAYYLAGRGLEFHVQVVRVSDGGLIETVGPVRTASADPVQAADVLQQRVRIALSLRFDQALSGFVEETATPPSYDAYLAYYEGGRKFARGDWSGALRDLLRAHELAPDFSAPLITAGFAVLNARGDFAYADSLVRIVEASRAGLPRYERLRLHLLQATLRNDLPGAYAAAREAADMVPGGSAHYAAASLALRLNRPREALALLTSFDPSRPFTREWTGYWSTVTEAHHLLGRHRRELAEARRARRQIPNRIEVLALEVRALAALGGLEQLERVLAAAPVHASPSDQLTAGELMLMAARELHAHGYAEAAPAMAARARRWCEELPTDEQGTERSHRLHATALYLEGRLDAARSAFHGLSADHPPDPLYLRYLGAIAARTGRGDLALAYSDSLARLEGPHLRGRHTLGRAAIAALLDDPEGALGFLRLAVSQGLGFGAGLHADPDLQRLREQPGFRAFLTLAD